MCTGRRVLFWKLPSKQSFSGAQDVGPTIMTLSPLSFLIIPWWMASKSFRFLKHTCGSLLWFLGPLTRILFGNAELGICSVSQWKTSRNITCLLYNLFVVCDKMKPLSSEPVAGCSGVAQAESGPYNQAFVWCVAFNSGRSCFPIHEQRFSCPRSICRVSASSAMCGLTHNS